MIKRLASGIVAMAFLASPAFSAPPTNSGFFVGGAFGTSEFDDDGAFTFYGDGEFDDSDTSFAIFAGYKFFRYFAVEARYGDLGTFSFSGGSEFDVSVISAHAVGIIPFGQSGWELYGQLGVGQIDLDCGGCTETAASAGLGVRFSPSRQLAIGVQIDAYVWEEEFADYYDFSVATMQAVVQYSF